MVYAPCRHLNIILGKLQWSNPWNFGLGVDLGAPQARSQTRRYLEQAVSQQAPPTPSSGQTNHRRRGVSDVSSTLPCGGLDALDTSPSRPLAEQPPPPSCTGTSNSRGGRKTVTCLEAESSGVSFHLEIRSPGRAYIVPGPSTKGMAFTPDSFLKTVIGTGLNLPVGAGLMRVLAEAPCSPTPSLRTTAGGGVLHRRHKAR